MPLSKPTSRCHAHKRTVACDGYEREDGLWDIEATMVDVKSVAGDSPDRNGYVAAGEHFHNISLRLTLDRSLLIH